MAKTLDELSDAELDDLYNQKIASVQPQSKPLEQMSDAEIDSLYNQVQAQPQETQSAPYSGEQALSDISTGARSLLKGFSGGISEPVIAGLNALQQAGLNPDQFMQAYRADIDRQNQQSNNYAGTINELAGALAPGSVAQRITGGVSKLAAPTAAQLIPEASQGLNLLQRGVQAAGQGAFSSAGEQAIRSSAEQLGQGEFNPEKLISDIGQAGKYGGAISGAIPFAGEAIKQTGKAIKSGAQKAATVLGGVRPEVVQKYIKNYDAINAAPTKQGAINQIDDFVQSLKLETESKKLKLDEAKRLLDEGKEQARFNLAEKGIDLREKFNQAKVELDRAYHSALEPIKGKANVQGLADDIDNSIGQLKQKVIQGSSESYKILDNAAAEGVQIDKKAVLDTLDEQINKLKVGGEAISDSDIAAINKLEGLKERISRVSSEGRKAYENSVKGQIQTMSQAIANSDPGKRSFLMIEGKPTEVQGIGSTFPDWFSSNGFKTKEEFLAAAKRGKGKVFDRIKEMAEDRVLGGFDDGIHGRGGPDELASKALNDSDSINPSEAKGIIQSLDRDITDAYNNNNFSAAFDGAAAQARRALDAQLKNYVPGYAEHMQEVAKGADLLNRANKNFKDKGAIQRSLGNITKETQGEKARILEELGQSAGYAFKDRLGQAKQAEEILSNPQKLKGIKGLLPETKKLNQIQDRLKEISNPRERSAFIDKATDVQNKDARKALATFESMKRDLSKVSQVAGQNGSKQAVETFLSSSKDKNIEVFKRLSALSDKDFVSTLENAAVKEAFTKGAGQGSRNVALFGALGTTIGGALGGGTGAAAGLSLGATLGGTVDKYGPAITKNILDKVVSMGKNPTVQKIKALQLPDDQKQYLIKQLDIAARRKALKD